MSFYVAMQNRRATASFSHPRTIICESSEFLIASRSGGQNQFLTLSNAGASTGLEEEAPSELVPDLVICATLVSQDTLGGDLFLVEREVPKGLEIKGRYMSGDGYLVLRQSPDKMTIDGSARFQPGADTRPKSDRCVLLGDGETGATVHISASYVPWEQEVLPSNFVHNGQPGFRIMP